MRTFHKSVLALLTVGFILISASCNSTRKSITIEEGWDLLGEQKVNFIRDRDAITVYNTQQYTAVRFKVEKRDVRINDLKIVFQNGDKLAPVLDEKIEKGQYSRIIELSKSGNSIRSIDFKYRTTGSVLKGRSNVLVFGKRYVAPY